MLFHLPRLPIHLLFFSPSAPSPPPLRREYLRLGELRDRLPDVPFMALTATATKRVRDDIATSLHMRGHEMVVGSFDRPNIFYEVKPDRSMPALRRELIAAMQRGGSVIIYCLTKGDTDAVYENIGGSPSAPFVMNGRRGGGGSAADPLSSLNVGRYHAGMNDRERQEVHAAFAADALQVVVATVAFGCAHTGGAREVMAMRLRLMDRRSTPPRVWLLALVLALAFGLALTSSPSLTPFSPPSPLILPLSAAWALTPNVLPFL